MALKRLFIQDRKPCYFPQNIIMTCLSDDYENIRKNARFRRKIRPVPFEGTFSVVSKPKINLKFCEMLKSQLLFDSTYNLRDEALIYHRFVFFVCRKSRNFACGIYLRHS